MKRSPIKAKRDTPRRDEGRVAHGRIKPKEPKEPTYLGFIASLDCLVCGAPATVHHVTSDGYKRLGKFDRRVAPLCPRHHLIQHGPHESVEALGHAGFKARYAIDLLAWAEAAWERRGQPEHPFWTVGVTRVRALASATELRDKSERGAPKDEQRRSTRSNQPLDKGATDYD